MPFSGPETVVGPPPLVAPPTGLIQACTVVEHPLLQTEPNLSYLVGPDAPDTILAAAILEVADRVLGPITAAIASDEIDKARVERVQGLGDVEADELRYQTASFLTTVAAVGDAMPSDRSDHWLSGITWSPEPNSTLELIDPCNDAGTQKVTFGATGPTGVSRLPAVAADSFLVALHDSCSTYGWRAADYVGRAQRGLAARETIAVEQEFMHGLLMGSSRLTAANAHLTNGSPNVTVASGDFTQSDVGRVVTASVAGLAAGTKILTVTDGQTIVLTNNFTGVTTITATLTLQSLAGGSNRFLADQNCVVYNTGAVDPTPVQGLAYACEVIARWGGGQGMIHVSAFYAEVAKSLGFQMQKDSRGRLQTLNGNIVVPGNGYDGVGPDGTGGSADDTVHDAFHSGHTHEWIYVSDLPVIWRPPAATVYPDNLRDATNRALNEVTFRAERAYIIEWSALLQVAIKVNVLGAP